MSSPSGGSLGEAAIEVARSEFWAPARSRLSSVHKPTRVASALPMEALPRSLTIDGRCWTVQPDVLLGKGGFATVVQARAPGGHKAALKVVDIRQQSTWATSKLQAEAENLRRAQTHAHIVRFHGELRIGSFHVFLLENWGHDLLDQVLEDRGLGEGRSVHIVAQVLEALTWLHSRRICHGCAAAQPSPSEPSHPLQREEGRGQIPRGSGPWSTPGTLA